MAYYTKVIRPEETLRCVGRLHWVMYLRTLPPLLIALAMLVLLGFVPDQKIYIAGCEALAALFAVIWLFSVAGTALRRHSTEIVVTDRRVIYKRGIIRRYTVEMNVSKIETVDVIQGVPARLLGYGTVVIRGTGAGMEPLRDITAPLDLRNTIVIG